MTVELVLGGARSGKSRFAEQRIGELCEGRVTSKQHVTKHYVATSEPLDEEMQRRIAHHQQQRGEGWQEWEVPHELANALAQFSSDDVVLVDCLTLWLNNVIYYSEGNESDREPAIEQAITSLVQALERSDAHIVLVSNEVGLGVVPLGEVSRLFVDNAGRMNQRVAAVARQVTLVAAGLPLVLKGDAK
ncbi:bifunctional adenosylcobinamide kinase/adenosylcobinamide-phosphate guanylyltransferase [Vibrio sp. 10N]|uniref:bifunctional adenosylcobinamide kinase/adenosylcobinamide-phosphate guanylyltransferase n=1 Tax=Vibrio sp. 10N TaxID=3058938 RepID=UPI00281429BD|nr:bifunctional adenosylcobinamide kinase/adenosylcobinamide-phosphate guanylyltransferase [Vibrio sp. 10N]